MYSISLISSKPIDAYILRATVFSNDTYEYSPVSLSSSYEASKQAYNKAQRLGLVQSYAAADMEYYYQNGVFYVLDADGQYRVILPPAGAIVEELPDDMKKIRLDGEVYYQVDDTIYQQVKIDGLKYYEVLGQLYR